tara:strand:+ start:375 stop:923 length:549 start_codon:yes stop_codon:yes gene_type:complete
MRKDIRNMPYKLTIIDWDGETVEQRSFDSRKSFLSLIKSLKSDIPEDWVALNGSQLKQLRKKWGMTGAVLAEKIGCGKGLVSQWETGARPISEHKSRKMYDLFKVLESNNHRANQTSKMAVMDSEFSRLVGAERDIIDALSYASYRQQRLISPEVAPERWAKIYECDTAKMELKFQKENNDT